VNILFSITYYRPYVSGLTLAASRWAEALTSRGYTVRILCMVGNGRRVICAKPLLRISKGFLSWDWVVKSWRLVQKHDVVVVNLPQFEGVIPAVFAKLFGKRLISIYHCEVELPEGFINSVVQSFLEISNFATLLLSDRVVTYTRDYANSSRVLKSLKVLKKKTEIAYIIPQIPKHRENKALTKKLAKRVGKTDYVVGIAARLAAEKGIEYVFEALPQIQRQIPNTKYQIKIAIAGPTEPVGEEAYKRKIMRLVQKLRSRVVFLGEMKPEDMGSFYRLIDVLVLPSVNSTEAFGMVQIEAMRCGVPVVASNLPGMRVPVQQTGMGLLVPPKDSMKLAQSITSVLTNRDRWRSLGRTLEDHHGGMIVDSKRFIRAVVDDLNSPKHRS